MGILVNQNQIGGGASNSSHNIGDIFYTTRTDNSLNGAVECNGSQYNFSDFDSNLQNLLDEGKLPYVSIGEFDSMVTNQGGCDSFGYGTNELTLYPVEIYLGHSEGVQYYSNVYDWTTIEPDPNEDYILPGVKIYDKDTHEELVGYTVKQHPLIGYDQWQLYNADNEFLIDVASPSYWPGGEITLPTGGEFQSTTYFKVPKKLSRVLVRTQKPTADNDYTWFNLYSDGWCEQGGICPSLGYTVIFPVVMSDVNYTALGTARDTSGNYAIRIENMTTTGMKLNSSSAHDHKIWWQVSGYAASSEYAQSTWEYQNVQVERPMVQLFNGATDEALATCTSVLSDVAGLKQTTDGMIDYVVEFQEPTAENEHTWYRLYKSGWVEQGGRFSNRPVAISITLPVEMRDIYYVISISQGADTGISGTYTDGFYSVTTTSIGISGLFNNNTNSGKWMVSGMSAQGSSN